MTSGGARIDNCAGAVAGRIKFMIDRIITERSRGSEAGAYFARAKLLMKGIDPARFTERSADDPVVIRELQRIASELNIVL
jgi:hypothetical protein